MSTIEEIAARHGFSADAGRAAYAALQAGGFSQAQFSHPELGGMGQWMSGGMMMIGDMFNEGLKWRVGSLLSELSQHREAPPAAVPAGSNWGFAQSANWWPAELGSPASSGSQNDMAYAWFPSAGKLLVKLSGDVFSFDTGSLSIYGVQQQQGGGIASVVLNTSNGPMGLLGLNRA
ncbi:MAG: SHOCT domain-containing protein [Proteobacteria bacterium]|nr:SHOCT domain-containing protein [Pseudomonadota bacterium]